MPIIRPNKNNSGRVPVKKMTNLLAPKPELSASTSLPTSSDSHSTTQNTSPSPVNTPSITQDQFTQEKRAEILAQIDRDAQQHKAGLMQQIDQDVALYKQEQMAAVDAERTARLEEAYEQGIQKAKSEYAELIQTKGQEFLDQINGLAAEKNTILKNVGKGVLKFALEMASLVIQKDLTTHPDTFEHVIDEAFKRITDKEKVVVRVNPEDIPVAQEYQDKFKKKLRDFKSLHFQEDPAIARGGCVIETQLGYIDSSISTKLSLIEESIMHTYNDEGLPELTQAIESGELSSEDLTESSDDPEFAEPDMLFDDQVDDDDDVDFEDGTTTEEETESDELLDDSDDDDEDDWDFDDDTSAEPEAESDELFDDDDEDEDDDGWDFDDDEGDLDADPVNDAISLEELDEDGDDDEDDDWDLDEDDEDDGDDGLDDDWDLDDDEDDEV